MNRDVIRAILVTPLGFAFFAILGLVRMLRGEFR